MGGLKEGSLSGSSLEPIPFELEGPPTRRDGQQCDQTLSSQTTTSTSNSSLGGPNLEDSSNDDSTTAFSLSRVLVTLLDKAFRNSLSQVSSTPQSDQFSELLLDQTK